jgi:signal transduction histidine kinase
MVWQRHSGSIRHKLNRVVLATTCGALAIAGLAMVVFDLRSYRQASEYDLLTQANLVGLATAPALSFNDPRTARENLELLKARPSILAAAIYRPDGSVFAQYARQAQPAPPTGPQAEGVRLEDSHLVVYRRIVEQDEHLGAVYLRADHAWLDHLKSYLAVLGVVMVITLALALLLSNGLMSVVIRPILAVSDVARRITTGRDYSLRATRTTDDEVGQVVDAFNEMLAELSRRAETLEEQVRRRTAQLEVANGELEAFSYSASHDLRSPLRVIDSFSSLLEKTAGDTLSDSSRHYLNRIRFNVRHMADLIDALLALAHVSRVGLQREAVDLGSMAAAVVEQCREREPERDAVVHIADNMLAQADPALLAQVMQNLVGNAWKFTSKVPQANISIGCEATPGNPVTYVVRDNGAGFDMAYADNLFGAFQRLHTPAEFPGTGIGLATVHRIITRHGGKIWADSTPGQGAAFFFTLDRGS